MQLKYQRISKEKKDGDSHQTGINESITIEGTVPEETFLENVLKVVHTEERK